MRSSRLFSFGSVLLLLSIAVGSAGATPGTVAALTPGANALPRTAAQPVTTFASYRGFPALYDPAVAAKAGVLKAPWAVDKERFEAERDSSSLVLANNQILAFYGNPGSKRMGILGEYPKEELARLLRGYAKLYDNANGEQGVVPAFYLIYGTCWPEGEIGYLKDSVVLDYIELAAREGMLVFVDHQIGKYSVEEAVRRILPFLKYPNVHLAIDPEWRTLAPMKEIGCVSAEELNAAQGIVQKYLDAEGIPGTKMLVVHQFKQRMIGGRERVRADFERVLLVHTADGFGSPALKRLTYAFNAQAENMPIKGFKLFLKTKVLGAGYDEPLLTPPEVLALEPRPSLIIYQ